MDLKTASSFLFVFLALAVFQGEALKCHQCSSYTDTQCNDPFHYEDLDEDGNKIAKSNDFLKDCPGQNDTLCRKIYQNVRGKERVIRSCGHIEYKNPCYKTVLEEYNTYVCTCKEDGCNGSSVFSVSLMVMLAAIGAHLVDK